MMIQTLTSIHRQDRTKSNELLQRAMLDYPEVVPILADKAGLNIPGSILSSPYFEMQVAYTYVVHCKDGVNLTVSYIINKPHNQRGSHCLAASPCTYLCKSQRTALEGS
jgi:hypothetical protein